MTRQDFVLSSGMPFQPFDQDEDQLFDDWYAAASAAAERGEPNPFGLSQQELAEIEADDESIEVSDDDDEPVDEDSLDVDDDEEGFDEPPQESRCDVCGGSGYQPGGDGAQCDECGGQGYTD